MAGNIRNMNEALKDETGALKKAKESPTISNSKVSHHINTDTLEIVNILVARFLKSVQAGNIDIHNTKELKDVITVFMQLHDIQAGGSQDTPQINIQAAKFMGQQIREPHDNANLNAGIHKKIPQMNSKNVKKFMENQSTAIDKQNLKKM